MEEMTYMEMVKPDGGALKNVPIVLRTYELCVAAVERGGMALEYVPEKLKTYKLCLAAVEQNGDALDYVPDELRARAALGTAA
jgi:hypothetical protein